MKRSPLRSGFTLIELMLVVAIIGLLAAIAIPKFAGLVIRAKETAIKGKLGTLRSGLSIYYADNEGIYPKSGFGYPDGIGLLVSKYLDAIPRISIPTQSGESEFDAQTVLDDSRCHGSNTARWVYTWSNGNLVVNCTHTDSKGTTWSLW